MPAAVIKFVWPEALDPSELLDYEIDWSSILIDGEEIASYLVEVPAESLLYGLQVGVPGGYATTVTNGTVMRIWVSVAVGSRNDPDFITGITLPIEVTVTTDATPPRIRQRTLGVKVIQR